MLANHRPLLNEGLFQRAPTIPIWNCKYLLLFFLISFYKSTLVVRNWDKIITSQ